MSLGSEYRSMAPRTLVQEKVQQASSRAGQPVDTQVQISYGTIHAIDPETSQVQIRLMTELETAQIDLIGAPLGSTDGWFLPVMQPLSVIHQLFGGLHKGMPVRVFWRGKLNPKFAIAEVLGKKDHDILNKRPQINKKTTGVMKFFSGVFGGN